MAGHYYILYRLWKNARGATRLIVNILTYLFLPFMVSVCVLVHWRTMNHNTFWILVHLNSGPHNQFFNPILVDLNRFFNLILANVNPSKSYPDTMASPIVSCFTFYCANMSSMKCRKTKTALELPPNGSRLECARSLHFTLFSYLIRVTCCINIDYWFMLAGKTFS